MSLSYVIYLFKPNTDQILIKLKSIELKTSIKLTHPYSHRYSATGISCARRQHTFWLVFVESSWKSIFQPVLVQIEDTTIKFISNITNCCDISRSCHVFDPPTSQNVLCIQPWNFTQCIEGVFIDGSLTMIRSLYRKLVLHSSLSLLLQVW